MKLIRIECMNLRWKNIIKSDFKREAENENQKGENEQQNGIVSADNQEMQKEIML
jgi:hypothetical protein